MLKVKKINLEGRYLKLYFKIKGNYKYSFEQIKCLLDEEKTYDPYIDETGKHIIITYLLRDRMDIIPYLKSVKENKNGY